MKWLRIIVLGLVISLVYSPGAWAQAEPSTSPPSSQAIVQLQQVGLQLQSFKEQIQNYQETWQALNPALQSLLSDSQTDSESLMTLTTQLNSSAQDSTEVSKLSTKLSEQFKELSISYSTAKLFNKIAIPVEIVTLTTLAVSIFTKGFTHI